MPILVRYRLIATCALLAFGTVCNTGCLVKRVKWIEPTVVAPLETWWPSSRFCEAEQLYSMALRHEADHLESSVDLFYQVAVATCNHDGPECGGCSKRQLHKSALTKLVVTGQRFGRLDPCQGLLIHQNGLAQRLPLTHHRFVWAPSDFHSMTPVGTYKTNAISNIHRSSGVGIPLVVTTRHADGGTFLAERPVFAATLRMNVSSWGMGCEKKLEDSAGEVRLELYDPLRVDLTIGDPQPQRIAKDISAPLAYRLRHEPQSILDNFINPDSVSGVSKLRTVEPYQPGKIPVVFIHGLLSNPYTWVEMANELRAQPGFVDHFQIWVFEYPTGQAFLSSAAELRQQLRIARHTFDPDHQDPQLSNMVLVGHSMGGLVSKLQVTSSGDWLWRAVANRPLEQVAMTDEQRRKITSWFYFEPSPDITRVIFMATPHRGSSSATRLIGRIGSSLVAEPEDRMQAHEELMSRNPGVFSDEVSRRIPTSIDLLEPNSQLLQAISQIPASCRVRMHSVIGDRCGTIFFGRSDGVVPVDSATERRAITERIVRATHTRVKDHPDSIQEILAILQRHLEESNCRDCTSAELSVL